MAKNSFSPVGRASWVNLESPDTSFDPENDKLEVTIVYGSEQDAKVLDEIVENAAIEKFGAAKFRQYQLDNKFSSPVKSNAKGCESGWQGYEDGRGTNVKFVTKASGRKRPLKTVDRNRIPVDIADILPGYHIRVRFTPYAWERGGTAGVTFFMDAVQLVKEDKVFGGDAEDFDDLPPEEGVSVPDDSNGSDIPF